LLVVGLIGIGIYVLFILNLVPGAAEERLGVLEPLPPDTGTWKRVDQERATPATTGGLVCEVRHYFSQAENRLALQKRYRDPGTNEIVRVDPERTIMRRRIRK
jgi:hypothetical protein